MRSLGAWFAVIVVGVMMGTSALGDPASGEPLSCRDMSVCRDIGGCTEVDGVCVAASDADCVFSRLCSGPHMACRAFGGLCYRHAYDPDDCWLPGEEGEGQREMSIRDEACGAFGVTTFTFVSLVFYSDGSFDREEVVTQSRCETSGQCTFKDGRFLAATDADCRGSELCRDVGRCVAVDGRCQAMNAEDCRATPVCQQCGVGCTALHGYCGATWAECFASGTCDWETEEVAWLESGLLWCETGAFKF